VGLSIGDPDVRMRRPIVDRWTVNYDYIFSRYLFLSSVNISFIKCLLSLMLLCLCQMRLYEMTKYIYEYVVCFAQ